jgi:septal ring factor EnvC (AmiA/AmiB activator)
MAVAMATFLAIPGGAIAAPPEAPGKIKEIEHAIKEERSRSKALGLKAQDITRETTELSRSLVTLGKEAQTLEQAVAGLRRHIDVITKQRRAKTRRLDKQRGRLTRLLVTLQRIARNPPEALLAYASTPQDTLRSARLLSAVIPHLETEARKLKAELASLQGLAEDAARRERAFAVAAAALNAKRREVNKLPEQLSAKKVTRKLAAKARNLHGLLRRIDKDRKQRVARFFRPPAPIPKISPSKPPPSKPKLKLKLGVGPVPRFSSARGRLAKPVIGKIVTRFGKKRGTATRAKGIRFQTAPGAQVIAPHDGHVVFADRFRGYGRLLIIDHGEGYHTLLAGLGRIDVAVNQRLLAGEPIGIMTQAGQGKPRLYLELRRNGRPINPLPWLAATPTYKVSG